jgi:mercuric ion transport protein
MDTNRQHADRRQGIAAAASLIGAVLVSSCCILPLVLVTLGVSGAWLGMLTSLAPYQKYFIVPTLVFLTTGFWYVYRNRARHCHDRGYCASPAYDRIIRIVLWTAVVLVALALGVNFLLPHFI